MKAISVRQPWADLIIQGKKTLDLRTRKIKYRGPIAIHASQTIEKNACDQFELDPQLLTAGAVIGVIQLADIFEMDQALYNDQFDQHLGQRSYKDGLFGWRFEDPNELAEPIIFKGRYGVFNIPDSLINDSPKQRVRRKADYQVSSPWDAQKPFELHVIPVTDDTKVPYRLSIYHPVVKSINHKKTSYRHEPPKMVKVVELGGQTLHAVADHVLDALRENDYKPTDLGANRKKPFSLSEESGVRLGLLFLAVKPVSKFERIENISHGLRAMTIEELYYWYSKCTTATEERGQKALRILLADE